MNFFPEIVSFVTYCGKVRYGRIDHTDDDIIGLMRSAFWIIEATNTHTDM